MLDALSAKMHYELTRTRDFLSMHWCCAASEDASSSTAGRLVKALETRLDLSVDDHDDFCMIPLPALCDRDTDGKDE